MMRLSATRPHELSTSGLGDDSDHFARLKTKQFIKDLVSLECGMSRAPSSSTIVRLNLNN